MNSEGQLSPAVRRWLEDGPSRAPDYLLPAVTREIRAAGREGASAGLRFGDRNLTVALVGVAASVVLLAGMALLALQLGRVGEPTVPSASGSARPVASPTSLSATLGGPTLSWTRVQDAPSPGGEAPGMVLHSGDRFLLLAGDAIWTSTDGRTWSAWGRRLGGSFWVEVGGDAIAAWEDVLVSDLGRYDEIAVIDASGPRYSHDFDEMVVAVGIGPAGIIVVTHGDLDHIDVVRDVLGREWERPATTRVEDGVLTVTRHDGESVQIVLGDHGYSEWDFTSRYAAWFSADGSTWEQMRSFPRGTIKSIVGTASGFYAAVGYEIWHSSDGSNWNLIGRSVADELHRWRDGVITDALDYWTVEGHVTDISVDAAPELGERPLGESQVVSVGTGGLGIVAITRDARILFSPDGERWSVTPLPADLLEAIPPDWRDFVGGTVGVSDEVVILDPWNVDSSAYWLGVPTP